MSAAGLDAAFQQAWEFRGSPYCIDAVRALTERYERVPLTFAEEGSERAARVAQLVQLLRDTDPTPAATPADLELRRSGGSHSNATPVARSMPAVRPAASAMTCGPEREIPETSREKPATIFSQGDTDAEDVAA